MERIDREKLVVGRMIAIYCRKYHSVSDGAVCGSCRELFDYACQRLEHCPKGVAKTSCRKCEIHCYSPQKRERIRTVMRYAGPRMIFRHPLSALRHLIDELK